MKSLKRFLSVFLRLIKNEPTIAIFTPKESPSWYTIALQEIGVTEIVGECNNPKIIEYGSVTTLKPTTDEIPWCADFICWCIEKAGLWSTKSSWARDYLTWGIHVETPKLGCIAIFSRGDSGHVGFYVKETETDILVLGGNQGNKVCMQWYPKAHLLGYRWPSYSKPQTA
jgi:uncharacterized protein (TIGR02594 family)